MYKPIEPLFVHCWYFMYIFIKMWLTCIIIVSFVYILCFMNSFSSMILYLFLLVILHMFPSIYIVQFRQLFYLFSVHCLIIVVLTFQIVFASIYILNLRQIMAVLHVLFMYLAFNFVIFITTPDKGYFCLFLIKVVLIIDQYTNWLISIQ